MILETVLPTVQYLAFLSLSSSHLYPPQGENCDSNSRLVVDEDDNGNVSLERVNPSITSYLPLPKSHLYEIHMCATEIFFTI